MKPGGITSPPTSMVCLPSCFTFPISAMRPSLIPTSPMNQGLPVPSTTRPFFSTRSNTGFLLPDLAACRHRHRFHGPVLTGQVQGVVQVDGATDVVGYDPERISNPEAALTAQGDHAVLLREPLQNGLRVPDYLSEPDEVQGIAS